jgi:hypothetical protein
MLTQDPSKQTKIKKRGGHKRRLGWLLEAGEAPSLVKSPSCSANLVREVKNRKQGSRLFFSPVESSSRQSSFCLGTQTPAVLQ